MMQFIAQNKEKFLEVINNFFGLLRKLFGIERDPAYYTMER